ncbi:hypothetical protein ABWH89_05135 [Hoeflea alexandrii]|uniref:hypothetical protein n=1 Tax=Hoeflea alexandrii TaxID=288436 RepID=UPI0035D10CE2
MAQDFPLTLEEVGFVMARAPQEAVFSGAVYDNDTGILTVPDEHAAVFAALADPETLPGQMLEHAKANARTAIIERANTFTAPILSKYPEAERAGWDKREAEARAIIAAGDKAAAIAATTVIKALATASGETTAQTVARAEAIAAKADEFAAISAAVEIMRDTALAAIEAVEDVADMPATLDALKAQATALAAQHGLA